MPARANHQPGGPGGILVDAVLAPALQPGSPELAESWQRAERAGLAGARELAGYRTAVLAAREADGGIALARVVPLPVDGPRADHCVGSGGGVALHRARPAPSGPRPRIAGGGLKPGQSKSGGFGRSSVCLDFDRSRGLQGPLGGGGDRERAGRIRRCAGHRRRIALSDRVEEASH